MLPDSLRNRGVLYRMEFVIRCDRQCFKKETVVITTTNFPTLKI